MTLVLPAPLFFVTASHGQVSNWQSHMDAGKEVCKQWHFADAVSPLTLALQEAESFGPNDIRLSESLKSLADAYFS